MYFQEHLHPNNYRFPLSKNHAIRQGLHYEGHFSNSLLGLFYSFLTRRLVHGIKGCKMAHLKPTITTRRLCKTIFSNVWGPPITYQVTFTEYI